MNAAKRQHQMAARPLSLPMIICNSMASLSHRERASTALAIHSLTLPPIARGGRALRVRRRALSIVYHAANPKRRPSLAFAVRLAAVAGVPVEALLSGKLAVAPAVIGVAA